MISLSKTGRFPVISIIALGMLLLATPYAMRFPPIDIVPDPWAGQRKIVVIFGLMAAMAAVNELFIFLAGPANWSSKATSFAVSFASIVIGWRTFPYWAGGVYQYKIGAFPWIDQDPKNLPPMIWAGDLWRVPIMLLDLCYYVVLPLLLLFALAALVKRRWWEGGIIAGSITVVAAAIWLWSPRYMDWLMD